MAPPTPEILRQVAAIRFGLGPRLDQPLPEDPEAWLKAQLDAPDPPTPDAPDLAARFRALELDRKEPVPKGERSRVSLLARDAGAAYQSRCIMTEAPFRERLVAFWANHLTVSRRAATVQILADDYLDRAIRPHATGRFADMLVAATRHPAMLAYLDNGGSVGPNSPAGRRRQRGMNENLAREILELHTLSPARTPFGGYTQGDVVELAKILSGWSFERVQEPLGFRFRTNAHEPGTKTLLGRHFEEGEAAGEAALRMLADHPATHRHLAVKLVRHFVADAPPPDAVRAIEGVLRDTGGDLGAAARALIGIPGAWDPPLAKLRTPQDHIIAACRALGAGPELGGIAIGATFGLGQTLWMAPAPNGWPDTAGDWSAPEGVLMRSEWVYSLAARFGRFDPREVARVALGPLARAETVTAVARAGSVRDALTLALASPEFMRR
jgi:uncharacterized protein (DUF1800 family)